MKVIQITLFLVCMLLVAAPAEARLQVVATLPALGQIAEAVGGEQVEVRLLSAPMQDPHFVPPKPTLARHLAAADALLVAGMSLESGWLPSLIGVARNDAIRPGQQGYIDTSRFLQRVLGKPTGLLTRELGDVHPEGNPHWWLDPLMAAAVARGVAEHFAALDPAHGKAFRANADVFSSAIEGRLPQWQAALRGVGPVVTYHDSFLYFVSRFEIEVAGFIEPKPGIEPSTAYLDDLVGRMRQQHVRAVWVEPYHNNRIARRVSELAGVPCIVIGSAVQEKGRAGYLALIDAMVESVTARQSGGQTP